jgi:hypothetical protein
VSFGAPTGPFVASLGINPSSVEFLGRDGALLEGSKRRLATTDSLGLKDEGLLDEASGQAVVDDCARYFQRRPYRRWFNPLDRVLRAGLGTSYWEGTASHLDLVQWATRPVWSGLDDTTRSRLLDADLPFLHQQLTGGGWRVVVVNGGTVMDWVARAELVPWTDIARLAGPPSARVCVGEANDVLFVGWSCNLQSQPGALAHAPQLGVLLDQLAGNRMSQ